MGTRAGIHRPSVILSILLVLTFIQPVLCANGLVIDTFDDGSGEADLDLRQPTYKAKTGITVPTDGVVIQGQVTVTASPWTQVGGMVHDNDEDFLGADSIEHLRVHNGTVALEEVPASLVISDANDWGDGVAQGLVTGETLSLEVVPGMAFQWEAVLSNASNEQGPLTLDTDSEGITHAVWDDNRKGLDIFYAKSADGIHYTGEKYVDHLAQRFVPQMEHDMVIGGDDTIHIVFADGRSTEDDFDIYYTRSTDGGDNFQPETRVDHGGEFMQEAPAIAVDASGGVHIVWQDGRDGNTTVYYSKDFGTEIRITNDTNGTRLQPDIAIDTNGWVHVAWRESKGSGTNWKLYHARMPVGGNEFQDHMKLNAGPLGTDQFSPFLEPGDDGRMFLAWHDNRALEYHVYLSSTEDGVSFTDPSRLGPKLVRAFQPYLAFDDGTLHAVWYDRGEGNWDVYYRNSLDNGESFSSTVRIDHDNTTHSARSPAITVGKDGWPRVAWVDFRQHAGGDLFATKGTVNHAKNGSLEVMVDLGNTPHNFTGASWTGDIPMGVSVEVWGRTSSDEVVWTGPIDLVNEPFNLTPGRYLELNITVSTANRAITPALEEIIIGYNEFGGSGTLVSPFIQTSNPVPRATIDWDLKEGEGWADVINLSLTVDRGLTWVPAEKGMEVELQTPGTEIGYKVDLRRHEKGTPVLDLVRLDYTEESYPEDVKLEIGDTTVWSYSGPFRTTIELTDIEDALNDYIGTIGDEYDEVTVPVEVSSKSIGTIVLSDLYLDMARMPTVIDHGPATNYGTGEGEEVALWVSVQEKDGRPLSYTWTLDGEEIEDADNSTLFYRPPHLGTDTRTEEVEVKVSNGYLTVSKTWTLTIEPSNRLPVIESHTPDLNAVLIGKEKEDILFSVVASDADGDILEYTWTVDGLGIAGQVGDDYRFYPKGVSEGSHTIEVEVSDGTGEVSQVWTVTILPIKDDGSDQGHDITRTIMIAMIIMLMIIASGIAFVEGYRRARGSVRRGRKRLLDEEERLLRAGEELREVERKEDMVAHGKVPKRSKKRTRKGKAGKKVKVRKRKGPVKKRKVKARKGRRRSS